MNIIKQFYLPVRQTIITIIVCIAVVAGVSLVSAWTGPTVNPPGGNVPAPINVGGIGQQKTGTLRVGGFTSDFGTYLATLGGNVGIGTASPAQKLDVAGYVKGQSGLCIGNDCRNSWPAGGLQYVGSVTFREEYGDARKCNAGETIMLLTGFVDTNLDAYEGMYDGGCKVLNQGTSSVSGDFDSLGGLVSLGSKCTYACFK